MFAPSGWAEVAGGRTTGIPASTGARTFKSIFSSVLRYLDGGSCFFEGRDCCSLPKTKAGNCYCLEKTACWGSMSSYSRKDQSNGVSWHLEEETGIRNLARTENFACSPEQASAGRYLRAAGLCLTFWIWFLLLLAQDYEVDLSVSVVLASKASSFKAVYP